MISQDVCIDAPMNRFLPLTPNSTFTTKKALRTANYNLSNLRRIFIKLLFTQRRADFSTIGGNLGKEPALKLCRYTKSQNSLADTRIYDRETEIIEDTSGLFSTFGVFIKRHLSFYILKQHYLWADEMSLESLILISCSLDESSECKHLKKRISIVTTKKF